MKHDLYDPRCRQYYKQQIDESEAEMEPFRRKRRKFIREFVGNDYGDVQRGPDEVQLIAMVRQMATTYTARLASGRPYCNVETPFLDNYLFSREFEANLNNLARIINVAPTIRECVLNSMFGLAIAKVGMGDATWIATDSDVYSQGDFPFLSNISLDNWFHDMQASGLSTIRFGGDKYLINEQTVLNTDLYDSKTARKLIEKLSAAGDVGEDTDTVSELSRPTRSSTDEGYRQFRVLDLWIPHEKKLYTFDAEMQFDPLAVVDYSSRVRGPYHFFAYEPVPDNTMPMCMADYVYEWALGVDSLYRKLMNQAHDAKHVMAFRASAQKDAERLRTARNGSYIPMEDPEGVKEFNTPGPDQNILGFAINATHVAEQQGGNYTAMAGLGAQTDTVGQEQLIHSQLNAMFERMQFGVVNFSSEIFAGLAAELWDDEIGLKTTVNLEEVGLPDEVVVRDWVPGKRVGTLTQYSFHVEPNSMSYQSPLAKANDITNTVMNVFLPLSQTPGAMQSGMSIDFKKFTTLLSKLKNQPELNQIVTFKGEVAEMPVDIDRTDPKIANNQPRRYVHESANKKPEDAGSKALQMMGKAASDNRNQG